MTRTGPVFGCGAMTALAICLAAPPAQARITRVQITATEKPTFGGYSWPGVGQYEKIAGKAFAEVDPTDPLNAGSWTSGWRRGTRTGTSSSPSTSTSSSRSTSAKAITR